MKFKYILIPLLSIFFYSGISNAMISEKKSDFVVVIDAGHGGKDVGAVDNGAREKDINLGVAKHLSSLLKKKMKDVKVVMTRDNDKFLTLQERANIANKNKGNLFISIHTNSLDKSNPNRRSASGTSVYALGLHKDKNNLQVARRENSVIELENNYEQKYSGFDPNKDESYIIFEMAQKKNLGQSLKFANLAQKELVKTSGRADRGVKQAGFWVLWATSMPSVLVELDFICNPSSAKFLSSESGQEKMAKALYNAIQQYVETYNSKDVSTIIEEPDKIEKEEKNATPILAAAEIRSKRDDVAPVVSNSRKSMLNKRRRRSAQAKTASLGRNYETEKIPVYSETARLAVVEKVEEAPVVEEEPPQEEIIISKKDKKSKQKKQKKQKQNNAKGYNNKKVVVNKDGSTTLSDLGDNDKRKVMPKSHKALSGYHSKVEKLVTVYKIQICACDELLKQNNPRFCGLTPVKSFRENNLYKYTYGESEDKKEIENLLKIVKEKIPDAFIISSKK